MNTKLHKLIKEFLVLVAIYTCLLPGISWAGNLDASQSSYLSPSVKVDISDFSQSFYGLYKYGNELLKKADQTSERSKFEKEFFNLSFKILFPEIIQYYLVSTIKQQILPNLDKSKIKEIRVQFLESDDPFVNDTYSYFEELGEKNLDKLIGSKALINLLLEYEEGKNTKRTDFAGFLPPRRGAKTRDTYIKKWLVDSIAPITGYPKKELRAKKTSQLWLFYYMFKLPHEFGKVLLEGIDKGSGADFRVEVVLNDDSLYTEQIRIEGQNGRSQAFVVGKETFPEVEHKDPTLEELMQHLPGTLRGHIHTLANQRNDYHEVIEFIRRLRTLKQTNLKDNITAVQKILDEIFVWSKRVHAARPVEQKLEVQKYLKPVLSKRGYLKLGKYDKILDALEKVRTSLEARADWLVDRIQKRNENELRSYYKQHPDRYVWAEITKNKLILVEDYVGKLMIRKALEKLDEISRPLFSKRAFEQTEQYGTMQQRIKLIQPLLNRLVPREPVLGALYFIEKADKEIIHITSQQRELERLLSDLRRWKAFRGSAQSGKSYQSILQDTIILLFYIQLPGAKQKNILEEAIANIKSIIDSTNASTEIKGDMKNIIPGRLVPVRDMLTLMLETINRRNDAVNKFKDIESISQARDLLGQSRRQFDKDVSTVELAKDIMDNLKLFHLDLTDYQYEFKSTSTSSFTHIGDTISSAVKKLKSTNDIFRMETVLCGQAI